MNPGCRRVNTMCRGFVAVEFSAAIALLLVPVVLLVASLPTWSEREHAATVIAREVARYGAHDWPYASSAKANDLVVEIATNLGRDPREFVVELSDDGVPGGQVRATVTVKMPAVVVPGLASAGAWRWSTTAAARIDDYRSR